MMVASAEGPKQLRMRCTLIVSSAKPALKMMTVLKLPVAATAKGTKVLRPLTSAQSAYPTLFTSFQTFQ